jgi:hypothetical protein
VPFRRTALLLAVVAGLHGLIYIPLVSTNEETDSWSYVAAANAIRDASYSTPLRAGFYFVFGEGWFDITGARVAREAWDSPERQTFRPPGYPLYLAPFGKDRIVEGDHTAALIGHGVLFGTGAWLLLLTVRRWWGESPALLAGLLYAVDPWSKHYVPLVLSETLAGLVVLALVYVLTRAWESGRWRTWAGVGALAASLALVRAVFVLLVPLVIVVALLRRRVPGAAAATLAAAVLLVPWLAWTNNALGRATMSAWGEGYNLILAASGEGYGRSSAEIEASPAFRERMEDLRSHLPPTSALASDPTAHPRYLSESDERLRDDALELYSDRLTAEPHQVAWEAVYRMWFLWAAHKDWYQPGGLLSALLLTLDWVLLGLALAGSIVAVRRGGPARAAVALLVAYTLVLATHHVEARFGMPLRGLYLALAGLGLLTFARARRERAE